MEEELEPGFAPIEIDETRNTFGQETFAEELRKTEQANEASFADIVSDSFVSGGNTAYQMWKYAQRTAIGYEEDPEFDGVEYVKEHEKQIPEQFRKQFYLAGNRAEADAILSDMREQLETQERLSRMTGVRPFIAGLIAGIIDVDAPLALFSGGLSTGATTGARIAKGALTGSAVASGVVALGEQASTTPDWQAVPMAALAGMGFGAVGGALGRSASDANAGIRSSLDEVHEAVADGNPAARIDPDLPAGSDNIWTAPTPKVDQPVVGSSVGAAQAPGAQLVDDTAEFVGRKSLEIIEDARDWAGNSGVVTDYLYETGNLGDKYGGIGRAAQRFHQVSTRLGLSTDFDKLMQSGVATAQKLAYDLFENAAGIVRNNRTAAMLDQHYQKQLLADVMPTYSDQFGQWLASRGVRGMDRIAEAATDKLRREFDEAVVFELQARMYDPPGTVRNVNPYVKEAADSVDRWSAKEVEISKGRPNEIPVKGYEKLAPQSGYFPQRWVGSQINKLIKAGRTKSEIVDAIAEGYMHTLRGVFTKDEARKWAAAVVRRAQANDKDINTGLIGTLQGDGRQQLLDTLITNGMSVGEANKLLDKLTGAMAERGQAGQTKGRVNIDLRFVASNGIAIKDLVDMRVERIVSYRSRASAGAAALARKGIPDRATRSSIIDAILDEQQADQTDTLSREFIEDMFTYFDGGAIGGGVSPAVARAKKLTNLALLNQLGLTQIAETGVQIAAVGWELFKKHAGDEFSRKLGNPASELAQELEHIHVFVPEERLFRDDFNLDEEKWRDGADSAYWQAFDQALNKGQRLQGYTSLFNFVRNTQQRIAVTSGTDKLFRHLAGIKPMSSDRLLDWGVNASLQKRLMQYVSNGTVEFENGFVKRLNFDKWKPEDVEDFSLAMNRHMYQVVQKTLAGESNMWMHKDVGALFAHLKSFTLLAVQKQTHRHLRIADAETRGAFLYSAMFAGAVTLTRDVINNRDTDAYRVMKGAFSLSNITGWIPMWTDPFAEMFGFDGLKFNTYTRGVDAGIIAVPAALPTLNRMLHIPGVPFNLLQGDSLSQDVRALQTLPIVGNLYGITAVFNALK